MANKTINDLITATVASDDDEIEIWRSANGDTRKIAKSDFLEGIHNEVDDAGQVIISGGTVTTDLASSIGYLERWINVKAFGAYGDDSSHLVGTVITLAEAQAAYPLTHAAFVIASGDELDWCAIQEAILTASADDSTVERVYIPVGSYKINRTLVVPMNATDVGRTITINGAGYRGTIGSGTLITLTAATTMFLIPGGTTLSEMAMVGADRTNASSIAVRIGGKTSAGDPFENKNNVHVVLDKLRFQSGWYYQIYSLYECDQLQITHCMTFAQVGRAVVYLSNDHAANGVSPSANVVIEQCHFSSSSSGTTGSENEYGIYLLGTENSVIRNCVIRPYNHIIYLHGSSGVRNYGLLIDGIHSEIAGDLSGSVNNRWAPNTAYALDTLIRPAKANANGWWYKCTTAGTSDATITPAANAKSLVNATYEWIASGKGTNEYYVRLAGGGSPGFTAPPLGVIANGVGLPFSWIGSLAAGEWGYGDNDTLGFKTIYVRLTDGADPDTKATHYVWHTGQEPAWPVTAGGTVTDGTVVWTAYKRSVFVQIAAVPDAMHSGLRVNSVYCENFTAFIWVGIGSGDVARISINGCTVRTCDMVYMPNGNVRYALLLENSSLEGSIKPFANHSAAAADYENQTSVVSRFCLHTGDLIRAIMVAESGIASWFTGETNNSMSSEGKATTVNYFLKPNLESSVMVNTSANAITVYVPFLPSVAWQYGMRGKQITITHINGANAMTLSFLGDNVAYNNTTPTSIAMNEVGDSVTIKLAQLPSKVFRWVLAGSYGV